MRILPDLTTDQQQQPDKVWLPWEALTAQQRRAVATKLHPRKPMHELVRCEFFFDQGVLVAARGAPASGGGLT